jgi:TRAP-type mannitol/chloroaromatic compound transport system permease small subunit
MHRIIVWIDTLNEWIGRFLLWLVLPMVLFAGYNAIARYLSQPLEMNLSSNALLEVQWYLFSVLILLGAGYVLKHDAHVRVDILYNRYPEKVKNWVNLLGSFLLAMPFCFITAWACMDSVIHSWSVMEMSPDPGGLPRYPIKTMIPIGLVLVGLQSFSLGLKSLSCILGREEKIDTDLSGHAI